LHGKKNIYIDIKHGDDSDDEIAADRFASDILIPGKEYKTFLKQDTFYQDQIITFAKKLNIHPGIVVGRLQHEGRIKHSWHIKLTEKYYIDSTQTE